MDRRSLLAAALTAPVVIAAPAVAAAPIGDSGLARCIAAYRAISKAAADYDDQVYDPAHKAWTAATDAVPHYTTVSTWEAWDGRQMHLSSNCRTTLTELAAQRRKGWFANDDYGRCMAELADAVDRREAEIARIRSDARIDEIVAKCDENGDRKFEALGVVIECPVRTTADLIAKIEFLEAENEGVIDNAMLLADLRRIAANARCLGVN